MMGERFGLERLNWLEDFDTCATKLRRYEVSGNREVVQIEIARALIEELRAAVKAIRGSNTT